MAANQRRKRLNSASAVGYSSREPYRVKKKNFSLPQTDANLRSHISLVWDGSKKRVVSKREQVGISWRKLRPFVDSVSNEHAIIADVLDVPREIFDLENLSEVLSLEVWQTHLSEHERNNLRKFLPGEQENDTDVVGALFSGDNFHFGNPLVKWESSLCSGALHPDAILNHEQYLRADKKAYSCELQKYHNNMIGYLRKLKDRCANCKDPEKEIIHQTWRSRNAENRVSTPMNDSRFDYHEDNALVTSESGSWAAEEKACSSDNQTSFMKGQEFSERMCNKGFKQGKRRASSTALDDMLNVGTRPEDKLQNRNIQCSDGSKYMSYFKISKKQHDLVKNMKQSGSLDQVLGDMQAFNVQPYQVFVEEEQKKLHEHWLQLSKVHIPVAYANWRETHLQKWNITKALEQDLKDRLTMLTDVDTENESHVSVLGGPMEIEADQMDMEGTGNESIEKSISSSQSSQSSEQVNGGVETDCSSEPENHDTPISGASHLEESGVSRNINAVECSTSHGEVLLSIGDIRSGPGIPKNYYSSSTSHDYDKSISNLSLSNSHADEERKTKVFDVEPDIPARAKSLLPRQSDDGTYVKSGLHDRDIEKILLPGQSDNGTFVEPDLHGRDIEKQLLHRRSDDGTFSAYDNQGKGIGNFLLHRQSDDATFTSENQGKDLGKKLLHRQSDDDTFSSYENQGKGIGNFLLHRQSDDGTFTSENQGKDLVKNLLHRRSDDGTFSAYENQGKGIGNFLLQRQSDDGTFTSSENQGKDIGKNFLHRQSDDGTFSAYENQAKGIGKFLLHRQSDDGTFISSENQGKDIGKLLLHRQSNDGTFSYENQGKDELLHSAFKRQGALSFQQKERHSVLDFRPSNNELIEESQYSRHFQEQPHLSLPLQQRRKEDEQVYIQHGVPENIYPDGNRYLIPAQQQFHSVGMQDWAVNPVRVTSHIHSHPINGRSLLGENWFSGEHQVRGGFPWSDGVLVPNQSIGSGSSSTDQTLFSVLSHGNQFRSPSHSMGSNGQFISPRNFEMLREGNPVISNVLPEASNPLDYLGGHEIPSQGMSWVGMRHQNSNLTDPMEKPYLRSWNQ